MHCPIARGWNLRPRRVRRGVVRQRDGALTAYALEGALCDEPKSAHPRYSHLKSHLIPSLLVAPSWRATSAVAIEDDGHSGCRRKKGTRRRRSAWLAHALKGRCVLPTRGCKRMSAPLPWAKWRRNGISHSSTLAGTYAAQLPPSQPVMRSATWSPPREKPLLAHGNAPPSQLTHADAAGT